MSNKFQQFISSNLFNVIHTFFICQYNTKVIQLYLTLTTQLLIFHIFVSALTIGFNNGQFFCLLIRPTSTMTAQPAFPFILLNLLCFLWFQNGWDFFCVSNHVLSFWFVKETLLSLITSHLPNSFQPTQVGLSLN